MKKGWRSIVAVMMLATGWSAQMASSGDETILEFSSMFGVRPPYTGPTNPIRGVPGGGAPWQIESGKGKLEQDGTIKVEVKGLVLVSTGENPVAAFRAVVSCQSIDGLGNPSIVNLTTGDFPATMAGDARIEERLELTTPCIAPIIFVTNPRRAAGLRPRGDSRTQHARFVSHLDSRARRNLGPGEPRSILRGA